MGEVRLEMVPLAGAGANADANADADADADASSEAGGGAPSNAFTGWRRSADPRPGAGAHDPAAGAAGAAQRRGVVVGDRDGDGDEDDRVVVIDNLHKTYLLGVEGLAALVCASTPADVHACVCITRRLYVHTHADSRAPAPADAWRRLCICLHAYVSVPRRAHLWGCRAWSTFACACVDTHQYMRTLTQRGVSLTIRRGEFVMLYGTSGGGKSTLLNIIGTIDRPTKVTDRCVYMYYLCIFTQTRLRV